MTTAAIGELELDLFFAQGFYVTDIEGGGGRAGIDSSRNLDTPGQEDHLLNGSKDDLLRSFCFPRWKQKETGQQEVSYQNSRTILQMLQGYPFSPYLIISQTF